MVVIIQLNTFDKIYQTNKQNFLFYTSKWTFTHVWFIKPHICPLEIIDSLSCVEFPNVDTFYYSISENHIHWYQHQSYQKNVKILSLCQVHCGRHIFQNSDLYLKPQILSLAKNTVCFCFVEMTSWFSKKRYAKCLIEQFVNHSFK